MADTATLIRFNQLYSEGYLPSVGAWVQVDPSKQLTTILNAFNTLAEQEVELFLFDAAGNTVGTATTFGVATNQAVRYDLEQLVPADNLPFEGSLWLWARGATDEGSIGLQAVDLEFIDRSRPVGHVLGSVHLIFDFLNTLGIPPYLDMVCPRLLIDETPEGAPRYQNFLGMAHVPTNSSGVLGPKIVLTVTNEAGERLDADEPITLPVLGSWFGDLQVIFPQLPDFLRRTGERRGYGVLSLQDVADRPLGLAAMVKVVDIVSGALLVGHMNDRNFARPAMKD